MSDQIRYVRLTPYNPRTGALCRRYTVGGRTFMEGRWYTVAANWAAKLAELKQDSGAPVFEVKSYTEYTKTAREEWEHAMRTQGALSHSPEGVQPQAPIPAPKKGPTKGEFDGMEAGEVGDQETLSAVQESNAEVTSKDVSPDDEDGESEDGEGEPEGGDVPNLDAMTKQELLKTANEYGVELDPRARRADMLEELKGQLT